MPRGPTRTFSTRSSRIWPPPSAARSTRCSAAARRASGSSSWSRAIAAWPGRSIPTPSGSSPTRSWSNAGELELVTVGRKGRDAMRRARVPIVAHFAGFGDRPKFADILPLARLISDEYVACTYNQVDVDLLPLRLDSGAAGGHDPAAADRAGQRHPRRTRLAVHLRTRTGGRTRRAVAAIPRARGSTRLRWRAAPASSRARWWR